MTPPTIVKLCFVLDCTGSMDPWIQASKTKIREIVDNIIHEYPNTIVEIALVGYRDYGDQDQFITIDFTNPDRIRSALRVVRADGGTDAAEDVAGAFKEVLQLKWQGGNVNMIVHITDAPAHGLDFHSPSISDRYPGGDPAGLDPRDLIREMSNRGYDFTFIKITSDTDKMINTFHTSWTGSGRFSVVDLRPQYINESFNDPVELLSPAVSRAVTHSITQYIASQVPSVD